MMQYEHGIVARPETESGLAAGAGFGSGAVAEVEFDPEPAPEAAAELEAVFVAAFEMKLVPGGGIEAGPLAGFELGTGPE